MTDRATLLDDEMSSAQLAGDLRVVRTRALRGANVWYAVPTLLVELRVGLLAQRTPQDVGEMLARLGALLPGLPSARAAAFQGLRAHPAGAWWGELVVRVTLELERLAGGSAREGRLALSDPDVDRWTVAIPVDAHALTDEAVDEATRLIRACLRGESVALGAAVAALEARRLAIEPGGITQAVIAEARSRGIPVRRIDGEPVVQLGLGRTQQRIDGTLTGRTSAMAAALVADVARLHGALDRAGIPVPSADGIARHGSMDEWPTHRAIVVNGRVVWAHIVALATESGEAPRSDTLREMHPNNRALCEQAAAAVGLDVAGITLRSPDISVPLRSNGGVVTSVEANPALAPRTGSDDEQRIAAALVEMLFPPGAAVTIPVIAITGTNGKTTTTRLIAHLFRAAGQTVGFTTTDGVYLQEQLLLHGDLTGPFAANIVLTHSAVDVAVLETARGGILKTGLGFERCDVAVVMNVTADHLGLRGIDTVEQLAEVKGVLPAVVPDDGYAVLNADDPLVLAMRHHTPGQVALFTMQTAGENAAADAHMAQGGLLARVEREGDGEHIVIRRGAERVALGLVRELPLTFGGLARFQIQNVLAASLAAYSQGVLPHVIAQALRTFVPSAAVTPGRLNLVETTHGRVLIDYAHNAAALAGLLDFVRAMPATRRMALLSAPGDRRDEDLREIGRLAEGLDLVILKEHEVYRRGREPGAIAAIMADGLRATGHPEARIATFVEEHDAVAHVMSVMQPGDVVIVIADDPSAVMRQLGDRVLPASR